MAHGSFCRVRFSDIAYFGIRVDDLLLCGYEASVNVQVRIRPQCSYDHEMEAAIPTIVVLVLLPRPVCCPPRDSLFCTVGRLRNRGYQVPVLARGFLGGKDRVLQAWFFTLVFAFPGELSPGVFGD